MSAQVHVERRDTLAALPPHRDVNSAWRPAAWFFLVLLALSAAMHRELLGAFGSAIPNDLGDPLLNTWIFWWNAGHLPFTADYWDAPLFAPAPSALALSETLLGLTWLTTPLQWLGASPVVAYNTVFVALPILNGMGGYALGWTLTTRHDAAVIAGLATAFAPYHASQLSHIQTMAVFWMPLALAALHRYWQTGRAGWLGAFAAAVALNGLTCGYYLLYFAPVLALVIVWLALWSRDVRRAAWASAALAAGGLALLPVVLVYRNVHTRWQLSRTLSEIEMYSADLATVLSSAGGLLWPVHDTPLTGARVIYPLYPGVAILALIAGFALVRRHSPATPATQSAPWRRITVRVLLVVAALLALTSIGSALSGPWATSIAGIRLSVTDLYKPIGATLDVLLVAALLSPALARSVRRGSLPVLYGAATIVTLACALGPVGRVAGERFWYKPPYAWLMTLPGFDTARVPALFGAVGIVCLAALAALALARLARDQSPRGWTLATLFGALIVVDGWSARPVVAVPQRLPVPVSADLVVELPTRGWMEDAPAMYRAMQHERPLVNGYSGFVPPHYGWLVRDLVAGCYDSLEVTRGGRSMDIIIWHHDPDAALVRAAVAARWPHAPAADSPAALLVRVPRDVPETPRARVADVRDLRDVCAQNGGTG